MSILKLAIATAVVFLVLEGLLRIGAYAWTGGSTYYLFYGFHSLVGRVGISPWSVADGGYYKFPSNYVLKDAVGQGSETASTNSLGFRGPDFDPKKPPNTFRIFALGGSSTFGFHNSDAGTYPYQLEQLLRREFDHPRIEVVNAGFPYYNTGSIRALLEKEILGYAPDLLTLYTAYNDTHWPLQIGRGFRSLVWTQQHSMVYLLLKEHVITDQRIYWMYHKLRAVLPPLAGRRELEERAEKIAARYRANLEAIADRAGQYGIPLILIRQPVTAAYAESSAAYSSYEEEYQALLAKLSNGEPLNYVEEAMIIHHRLIAELDAFAKERGLPVVDNIAIVDRDRDRLTTWVHLTEEANLALAEALKETIEPSLRERNGGTRPDLRGSVKRPLAPSRDDRAAYEPERSRVWRRPVPIAVATWGSVGWRLDRREGSVP